MIRAVGEPVKHPDEQRLAIIIRQMEPYLHDCMLLCFCRAAQRQRGKYKLWPLAWIHFYIIFGGRRTKHGEGSSVRVYVGQRVLQRLGPSAVGQRFSKDIQLSLVLVCMVVFPLYNQVKLSLVTAGVRTCLLGLA